MVAMAKEKKIVKPGEPRQVNIRFNAKMVKRLEDIGEPLGLDLPDVVRRAVEEYVQRRDSDAYNKPAPIVRQPRPGETFR